jgi:putative ABC transport system substrate-binding protein
MRRRKFIALDGGAVAAWPIDVRAQQTAGRVHRIGYLSNSTADSLPHLLEAFRQGLRDLGWVEGHNLVIDYRFAEGRFERLPELAAELVRIKVDVIVAAASAAAVAAKNATDTIPIVMVSAGDPVGLGLIASLSHPGGNVTGLSYSAGLGTITKGLELIRETLPAVRKVAVLFNPANPAQALAIKDLKTAAVPLGMQLQPLEARGPDAFDGAFAAMAKERVGALLVVAEGTFIRHRAQLADLAAKNRLPTIHGTRENVEAGGLIHYGPDLRDQSRRGAAYVDKILKGAKPADVPVEQPTKFELVINLKTAKTLGLTVPPTLLARADEVIE